MGTGKPLSPLRQRKVKGPVNILTVSMAGLLIYPVFSAYAGNSKMVEKSVETLDKINKEAVRQIPDMPADGRIELKAEGTHYDGKTRIRVKRYRIAPLDGRSLPQDKSAEDSDGKENKNEG